MRTVQQIRHANLLLLLDELEEELGSARGAAAKLATLSGVKAPIISQLKNLRSHSVSGKLRAMGDDVARKLEQGMDKPNGWMDQDRGDAKTAREALLVDLCRLLTLEQTQTLINLAEQFAESNGRGDRPPGPRPRPDKRH